jgi:CheY-like chemotaxis protein/anti-sigma regulatory factor (Ser/Thr protein kinase)
VDLESVIAGVVETMRPGLNAKAIRLDVVHHGTPEPLLGDAARLQQVIWNLLSNAVKFTPGGGSIRVDVHTSPDETVISVSDTGQGISKRLLPFVFDRFRQGDSSATRAHGGLGVGLAIVKNLIELHGGSVTAESEGEGRGAVFTVRLPAANREHASSAPAKETAAAAVSLSGVVVLLVEDDDDTRVMLRNTLERHGAHVIAVNSAPAAIDALRESLPHVVISDIAMPGEDGVSLMTKVRSGVVERARNVPAIAITAYAHPEDRGRLLAAGFQEHLRKPIDTAAMLQSVRNAAAEH